MDTHDQARLQAERNRLERVLLSIEEALGKFVAGTDDTARLQLAARQESCLAELCKINAELGASRSSP